MSEDDLSAERVARNEATFRSANEKISRRAEELHADGVVPFICECATRECTEIVLLPLSEYERVRGDATLFLCARGHVVAAGPYGELVERRDGYDVVKKLGRAAEIVKELDPRAREGA